MFGRSGMQSSIINQKKVTEMKLTKILLAALFVSGTAFAANATTSCERLGNSNNYRCDVGDNYLTWNNKTEAEAIALSNAWQQQQQAQQQQQGQAQGQIATGGTGGAGGNGGAGGSATGGSATGGSADNSLDTSNSAYNGGNVVEISNPSKTTSKSFSIGFGANVTLLNGVEATNARDAAKVLDEMGYECIALDVMLHSPGVRKLGYDVKCTTK